MPRVKLWAETSTRTSAGAPLVVEMREYAADLVKAASADTLEAKIGAIETELRKAKPEQSVLRELLNDIRNALSGAAGNIVASGVIYKISQLLGG